jgi:hypothetical protein
MALQERHDVTNHSLIGSACVPRACDQYPRDLE